MIIALMMAFGLWLCPQTMFNWLTRFGWALLLFVFAVLVGAIVL